VYIWTFYVLTQACAENEHFPLFVEKRQQKCSVNSNVEASKFVFFTCDTKNVIFPKKIVAT
jgi:hypothetical protein